MADKKERKTLYYEIVSVAHPSFEKGLLEFNQKINTYEATHDVEHRLFSLERPQSGNGSFHWVMVFCCEREEYENEQSRY